MRSTFSGEYLLFLFLLYRLMNLKMGVFFDFSEILVIWGRILDITALTLKPAKPAGNATN